MTNDLKKYNIESDKEITLHVLNLVLTQKCMLCYSLDTITSSWPF